jgi:hypothetical protein
MSSQSKKKWTFALAFSVFLILYCFARFCFVDPINETNFKKINVGMKEEEVEFLLGRRADGNYTLAQDRKSASKIWRGRHFGIEIFFDHNNRVEKVHSVTFLGSQNLFVRFLHAIGLY